MTPLVQSPAQRVALAACPFCGEPPEIHGSTIECVNIRCWGPSIRHMAHVEDSINAWNRRSALPPEPALTDEDIERVARAMCVAGGYNPDRIMANDGPRWRYYVTGARAAILAFLSREG